jgi:hypothetical protein
MLEDTGGNVGKIPILVMTENIKLFSLRNLDIK